MQPTADGSAYEDIDIPSSLLITASVRNGYTFGYPRPLPPLPPKPPPHRTGVPGLIRLPKRRQPTSASQHAGHSQYTTGQYRRTQSTPFEEGSTPLTPVAEDSTADAAKGSQSHRHSSFQGVDYFSRSGVASRTERKKSLNRPPFRRATINIPERARDSSLWELYDKAKLASVKLQRKKSIQLLFEYGIYALVAAFIYLFLIGIPLWKGAVYWLYWVIKHKFVLQGGWAITLGLVIIYSFVPLLSTFEKDTPSFDYYRERRIAPSAPDTALLIPCFKSAKIIRPTLEAALKVFPASHIYVIANGNSPEPLDNTEEVCCPYGVNHIWSPIGSKVIAQFIGCYAAKRFRYVLLMDDDCVLPPNFPVVVSRLSDKVRCIGYTLKSVASDFSKGSLCQQAQDLEYKISGLQRIFAGKVGSATFPHGAISLWDREFLKQTFRDHPGFSISEDWFLGNSCRRLGGRIQMCSSVFVETSTPSAVFYVTGGQKRGGFGEMTVFKQRFLRWNFFFGNGLWYNMVYIVGCWKLGWWEIGTKLFVFQEVYETLLYVLAPFILPISFLVRPAFCGTVLSATLGVYLINAIIFNEIHLRLKKERISMIVVLLYYMPYKVMLTIVNVASCYWAVYKYARYFAQRHPKVVEDQKAVEVVLKLQTQNSGGEQGGLGRSMTVRAVGARMQGALYAGV